MCRILEMNIGDRKIQIADIKEKYISNIIDAASKCDLIDKVVLFGSSIEERCKDSSDIDLAIFGNQVPSKALTSKKYREFARQLYAFDDHSQAYDLLYFKTGSRNKSFILNEIEEGEVLYVRDE